VQADEAGRVWHVLEPASVAADLAPGTEVAGHVDWARRFDHMQQHTGQHVLSAALERVLAAPTLSSHLGEERSSLEVGIAEMRWQDVERLERAANDVVWEDRPVRLHWTDESGLGRFALRKPPAVSGPIRIVEIPDWDLSACGGTHTRRTGEVGVIKVVRWERVRGNVRLEFLCGRRALEDHAWRAQEMGEAARRRTLKDRDLIAHLERAAAERDALRKRLDELDARLAVAEARERVGEPPRPVADFAASRPRDALRRFAIQCLAAGAPWVAAGSAAPEAVVVLGRAKSADFDLRTLLPELLARSRGRGGGSPDLLQVAAADAAGAQAGWQWASDELAARLGQTT
jgi:alanyl-tRNA synthetase